MLSDYPVMPNLYMISDKFSLEGVMPRDCAAGSQLDQLDQYSGCYWDQQVGGNRQWSAPNECGCCSTGRRKNEFEEKNKK